MSANKVIIDRILALLALADPERNSSEGERSNAQRKAEELMAKHGIDIATLDATPADASNEIIRDIVDPTRKGAIRRAEKILSHAIADFTGVKLVIVKRFMCCTQVQFFGDQRSVVIAQRLYQLLRDVMTKRSKVFTRAYARNQFQLGFAAGIQVQVDRMPRSDDIRKKESEIKDALDSIAVGKSRTPPTLKLGEFGAHGYDAGLKTNMGFAKNLDAQGEWKMLT